jgi:hypothetical protein
MNAVLEVPATTDEQMAFASAGARKITGLDSSALSAIPGFTMDEIWDGYSAPKYLVKLILGPGEVTTLFGESGHFKSVLAIDLALCVASGRAFHGYKVRHGGVLYTCGEGHGGVRKRLRAWLISHGFDASSEQPALYVTRSGANLTANPLQLTATVQHAERVLGTRIGLLVLDTLAANFGPGDENEVSAMSLAIEHARHAAPEAAILLVHHTGHADKKRERGSYALIGAADYRLQAVYDEPSKLIELCWHKIKDDERPQPLVFTWKAIPLEWQDDDGEELTSVVLERSSEAFSQSIAQGRERSGKSGLGNNQDTVLRVLKRLYRQHGENLSSQGRDRSEAKVLMSGLRNAVLDEKRMDSKRFPEAIEGLQKRGLIRVDQPHVFLIEGTGE